MLKTITKLFFNFNIISNFRGENPIILFDNEKFVDLNTHYFPFSPTISIVTLIATHFYMYIRLKALFIAFTRRNCIRQIYRFVKKHVFKKI